MNGHSISGGSGTIILLILGLVVVFAGCGCLSDTNNNSNSAGNTAAAESYNQSSGSVTESGQTYSSAAQDISAVKVTDSGTFSLSDSSITKTGDASSSNNSYFYGLNAGVLAEDGAAIALQNCTITTDANDSNAVFATGSGSSIILNAIQIYTGQDGSCGVEASAGGSIQCTNVCISTWENHCAGIASSRAGGTIAFTGGTVTTAGEGSPGVYSTGDITVSDSVLTATGSEATVIEGKNTIALNNCSVTGMVTCGAMLYQNSSEDTGDGTGTFTMNGGMLRAAQGPLFYSTNTQAVLNLKGVQLAGESGVLLNASADRWGNEGSNGAAVTLNANEQVLKGNIICDGISSVTVNLRNDSAFTGTVNAGNTAAAVVLTLDPESTWNVTGDSYLTGFTDGNTTMTNIRDNGFTIYYDANDSINEWLGAKTYVLGDSGELRPMKE